MGLSLIVLMKSSGFKMLISVESYDGTTVENYRNYHAAKKPIVLKLSKISIQSFDNTT